MNKAIIFDIQHGSVVDGPGMRTTFFSKVVILGVAGVTIPKVSLSKNSNVYKENASVVEDVKTLTETIQISYVIMTREKFAEKNTLLMKFLKKSYAINVL